MGKVAKVLFSPIAAIGKALFKKPKMPAIPVAPPMPTRNAAAEAAGREDGLRRRRGQRANDKTKGSAEARSYGGKTLLGE